MISLRRRSHPYIVGEIGFLISRLEGQCAVVELCERLTDESADAGKTIMGMGCVEQLTADGALARLLKGAELEDALMVFGGAGLRLAPSSVGDAT